MSFTFFQIITNHIVTFLTIKQYHFKSDRHLYLSIFNRYYITVLLCIIVSYSLLRSKFSEFIKKLYEVMRLKHHTSHSLKLSKQLLFYLIHTYISIIIMKLF